MHNYNSQCLLYNLVREHNILKSQINKLNDIIINNKSSTSGNTSSGLSKDEVTQLIQNTDPKEHEHTSSQISDRISEYSPKAQLYEVKLQSNTVLSCYFESQTKIVFRIDNPDDDNTKSFTLVYEGQEYEIDQNTTVNDHIKCDFWTNFVEIIIEDIKKSIDLEIKDFVLKEGQLNDEKISIIYLPNVKIDKVITQQAVKEYIQTNSISIYSNENKISYNVTPYNIGMDVIKQEDGSYKLESCLQINSFNLKYKGKTYEIGSFPGVQLFEDLIISGGCIDIILPLSYNDEITLEFTKMKYIAPPYSPYLDKEYPDITVHITVEKPDMNIDRLMTANAVKECVKSTNITSSQISDRIKYYTTESVEKSYTYHLPDNSIFALNSWDNYICVYLSYGSQFSITIEYDTNEETITQNKIKTYNIGNLKISFSFVNRQNVDYYMMMLKIEGEDDIEGEIKVKNITISDETKPDETIAFKYIASKDITDMTSKRLMTANAVQDYVQGYVNTRVEEILKEKGVIQ